MTLISKLYFHFKKILNNSRLLPLHTLKKIVCNEIHIAQIWQCLDMVLDQCGF